MLGNLNEQLEKEHLTSQHLIEEVQKIAEEGERNKEENLQVIDTQKREIEALHEKAQEVQNSLAKGQEALVEFEVRQENDSRLIESLKKDLEMKSSEIKSLTQLLAEKDEKERSKNLEFENVQKNLAASEEATAGLISQVNEEAKKKEAEFEDAISNNYQVVKDLKAKLADSEAQQLNKRREIETLTLEVEAKENRCRELSEELDCLKETLENPSDHLTVGFTPISKRKMSHTEKLKVSEADSIKLEVNYDNIKSDRIEKEKEEEKLKKSLSDHEYEIKTRTNFVQRYMSVELKTPEINEKISIGIVELTLKRENYEIVKTNLGKLVEEKERLITEEALAKEKWDKAKKRFG